MKLATAKIINKISRLIICVALAGLVCFLAAYFMGKVEFKYFSLPVMICFIGITWCLASGRAIIAMEEAEKEEP